LAISEKNGFKNFTQKTHDSYRKNIKKKIGQFYVTLICSSNLHKNRMILVVKTSKKYVTFTTSRLRAFSCTLFHRYSEQRVRGVVMR